MKYKVGDKVRIKSHDWYLNNKNKFGKVWTESLDGESQICFDSDMILYCGMETVIFSVERENYVLKGIPYAWTDEMIEGLVEEETKPKFKVGDIVKWYNHTCNITSIDTNENTHIYLIKHNDYRENKIFAKWVPESELTFEDAEETKPKYEDEVTGEYYSTPKYLVRPYGYQFVDENGNVINAMKIVLKKKKEYPKTYEECAEIIAELTGSDCNPKGCMGYMSVQLTALQKLLICRGAYWKIAGEEMGLGKPWEPDWTDLDQLKYCIWVDVGEFITMTNVRGQHILAFPTEKMRDAFKENFDPDIEFCKEFL